MDEELDRELTELFGALSPEECKVVDKLLKAYHQKNNEILVLGSKITDLANKITEIDSLISHYEKTINVLTGRLIDLAGSLYTVGK